jgi:hypothetical protein
MARIKEVVKRLAGERENLKGDTRVRGEFDLIKLTLLRKRLANRQPLDKQTNESLTSTRKDYLCCGL